MRPITTVSPSIDTPVLNWSPAAPSVPAVSFATCVQLGEVTGRVAREHVRRPAVGSIVVIHKAPRSPSCRRSTRSCRTGHPQRRRSRSAWRVASTRRNVCVSLRRPLMGARSESALRRASPARRSTPAPRKSSRAKNSFCGKGCDMAPRRATEQIDASSQPSVRVRLWVSRWSFETVPSLRTPIFSRFRG